MRFIYDHQGVFVFYFTVIYGLDTLEDKRTHGMKWGSLVSRWHVPLLLPGDFNTILDVQDRVNGAPVSLAETFLSLLILQIV